jgi:carbon-monoxide dehydrogenase medium subunit
LKPPALDYVRAASVAEALRALGADEDAKLLAGGQSLMPMLNLRLARPSRLVDVSGLQELDRVFDEVTSVLLGALVRHRRLETDFLVAQRVPVLCAAAAHIGHRAIRHQGTLGGSLAHADAVAELPAVMVLLNATIFAESESAGRREIAADDFFTGHYTTALEPHEMITWVRVPVPPAGSGWGFEEIARRHGDFALAAAGCLVRLDAAGAVEDVRAVLVGAADTPLLLPAPEQVLGAPPSEAGWRALAQQWAGAVQGGEDLEYRRDLAQVALTRALEAAAARAERHP